jgi:hypothetical protein
MARGKYAVLVMSRWKITDGGKKTSSAFEGLVNVNFF